MTASAVEVMRGGEVESRHVVHAVVAGWEGDGEVRFGDPALRTYWRSSMKPFQALPLVEDGAARALGMDGRELALCCASHVGTDAHVDIVAGLLRRLELEEDHLHCGPHPPLDGEARRAVLRAGQGFTRLHNNCSGKHGGMLALARHHGWPVEGYAGPDHPVQARIRRELARWLDVDPEGLTWGVDGCGVPTPCLPLRQMARAFARLARAAGSGQAAADAVVRAMTGHPHLVSGSGRPTSRVMEATGGRVLAKEGAEGVFCLAGLDGGWGMALKVADGSRRAAAPAAVEALASLGLLTEEEVGALEGVRRPEITNTRGDAVGRLTPRMQGREAAATGP